MKITAIETEEGKQQEKEIEKFNAMYHEYVKNKQLTGEDMKVLMQEIKHLDDSPVHIKMVEMKEQWENKSIN
jgi:hypothetical protein